MRDSNGWTITGGSTIDLGGVSKLEGFAGYSQQTYLNPGLTTPAFVFGLAGVWNGYEPLIEIESLLAPRPPCKPGEHELFCCFVADAQPAATSAPSNAMETRRSVRRFMTPS